MNQLVHPLCLDEIFRGGKAIRKLTLPPLSHVVGGDAAIQELLNDCAPATFGNKGEEVLDDSY